MIKHVFLVLSLIANIAPQQVYAKDEHKTQPVHSALPTQQNLQKEPVEPGITPEGIIVTTLSGAAVVWVGVTTIGNLMIVPVFGPKEDVQILIREVRLLIQSTGASKSLLNLIDGEYTNDLATHLGSDYLSIHTKLNFLSQTLAKKKWLRLIPFATQSLGLWDLDALLVQAGNLQARQYHEGFTPPSYVYIRPEGFKEAVEEFQTHLHPLNADQWLKVVNILVELFTTASLSSSLKRR